MSLRAKVLSGLLWSGGARMLSQLVSWAITIVVIRLLTPADYGLLAMATVFMALLSLLAEAGLGPALARSAQLDDATLRRAFGAVILINGMLFAVQFAAAPAVARFYHEDRLIALVRVLGLHFLISIFAVIPSALIQRRLDFKTGALAGLAASICGSLCSLGLALAGYGVWALVIGHLASSLVTLILLNYRARFFRLPEFSLKGMRELVSVGAQITAARVLYFIYSQADIFIAGRMLGKELLGFYSVSLHLASLPVQRISSVVNGIAFQGFAEAQRNPETVPRHMLKVIRLLSLFSFPVLWGISSIAREVVTVLLGSQWELAVLPLQLLPLVMPINMLSPFLNSAFQGIGRTGIVLANAATAAIVLPLAFLIGANWGLLGLCLAWLIAFPVVILLNLRRMMSLVGLKTSDVLVAIAPPALAAAGMYACVTGARHVAGSSLPAPLLMAALVATGAVSFAAITWMTNRKGMRELLELFRQERTVQ